LPSIIQRAKNTTTLNLRHDLIQGYFYSPPMVLEKLIALIDAEQDGMLASCPDVD